MSRRTEVYGGDYSRMRSQSTDARPGKRIFSRRVMANHGELNLFGGMYAPPPPTSPKAPEAREEPPLPTRREYRSRSAAAAAPGSNYRSRLLAAPSEGDYDRVEKEQRANHQRAPRGTSPSHSRGRSPTSTSGARARGRAALEAGLEGNLPPISESEDDYGSHRGRESGSRMMRMPRVQGIDREDSEAYTDEGAREFPPPSPKMSPRLNQRTSHRRVHSSTPAFQSRGRADEEGSQLNDTIDDLPPPPPINFDRAADARLGRSERQPTEGDVERDAYLYGDRLLHKPERGRDSDPPHHRATSSSRVAADRARQHRQDFSHRYDSPNNHGGSRRELLKGRRQYEVDSQTSDFTLSSRDWSSTPAAGGRRRARSSTVGSGRRQARPAFDNTPYVSPPRGRGRELGPFAGVGAPSTGGRAPAGMGSSGLGSMSTSKGRRMRTTSTPIKAINTSRLPVHRPVNPITGDAWYDGRDRPTESVWDRAYDITPDINHPERTNPMTKQEMRQKVKPAAVFSSGSPFDWSLQAPLDR